MFYEKIYQNLSTFGFVFECVCRCLCIFWIRWNLSPQTEHEYFFSSLLERKMNQWILEVFPIYQWLICSSLFMIFGLFLFIEGWQIQKVTRNCLTLTVLLFCKWIHIKNELTCEKVGVCLKQLDLWKLFHTVDKEIFPHPNKEMEMEFFRSRRDIQNKTF